MSFHKSCFEQDNHGFKTKKAYDEAVKKYGYYLPNQCPDYTDTRNCDDSMFRTERMIRDLDVFIKYWENLENKEDWFPFGRYDWRTMKLKISEEKTLRKAWKIIRDRTK